MAVAEAGRRGNRGLDRLDEVAGPLEGLLLPPPHDRSRDLARVALLAVALEDRREIAFGRLVDDAGGRHVGRRVHAHVERRVGRVGEAAFGAVDLHRRDAEVHEDRVRLDAVLGELVEDDGEVPAQEARLATRSLGKAVEVLARSGIAVDRDHLSAAAEIGREQGRMPARAEGCVDQSFPWLQREELAHLVGEDRDVINRACRQDVRQHPQHSLRPLPAQCARRRGPRSRAGR